MPHFVLATLVALSLAMTPAAGAQFDPAALDAFVEQRMASTGSRGVALAITQGDRVIHLRGYGEAGPDRPVTAETPFLLASVSKSFTAIAVLQLVQNGRVDLDAPVATYLPEFRTANTDRSDRISVRHLLNHTSGMSDSGFPHMTLRQPSTIAERVASLAAAQLTSEPGERFQYFDPNYAVAARIVEVVSGEPFGTYLQRHVLAPLGMDSSKSLVTTAELSSVPDLARGHILAFGALIPWHEMDGYLAGSTGVVSTASDMARYLMFQAGAHRNGDAVLDPHVLRLADSAPAGINGAYGMGWELVDGPDGRPVLHHNGVLGTFHADMVVVPDEQLGIVLLYNSSHALANYDSVWRGVLEVVHARAAPGPRIDALQIELAFGILTALTLLLRLPGIRRVGLVRQAPAWRRVAGLIWAVAPTILLVSLSSIVGATAGRVFSLGQLLLAMPGPVVWIAVNAAIGLCQLAFAANARWRRAQPQRDPRAASLRRVPERFS